MKEIKTEKAPLPVGPYSQAVTVNDFLFISGQIGIDPETGKLREGIEKQTEQILKNIEEILKAAGTEKDKIVKTTIFVKDIKNFQKVNAIYKKFFENSSVFPARSTVEVSNLPLNAEIEIECVAIL
ncbi:RidA family protein [Desulfurobacterium atlanticum]|uniref:2-iminobutanoate/2-iminopropanoate deaminase n=1 Tax=Desulfurobacterium atlanticum TaxID=240169 RepID=A0A238ZYP3_9BACT|nr:RidA family protein [Desulfurobacterium atlanticum]SNR88430.1 2-iminobutanoate/2-iminopropanoate deaminase [Desulfurobacterium atlanticum]